MEFKNKILSNGLTIVGEVNNSAQSAAVGFFVKTGSRDEDEQINGVSHFLEHMLFKGTEKLSALEVNEAFDKTGAQFNAFTSEENTVFYAAVLPEYLLDVTSLWTQLMRPALRKEDFELEKNVIKEEIAMYKDSPQFDVADKCRHLHFAWHPCGLSVLGSEESITGLADEQMRQYFNSRYVPDILVVACVGNFCWDKLCELVESGCGGWQEGGAKRTVEFYDGSKEKKREGKSNLVCEHVCLMSSMVAAQDQRRFAAMLLSIIIGDATGSRFFWELVETALAETAVSQFEPMDGVGAVYSYIRCSPENLDRVLDIVGNIFATLADGGVKEDELRKAKNKVLSAITLKNELPMGRLVDLGGNWIYLQKYRRVAEDVAAIKAVTVSQINSLIAEFKPGDFTQFSIGPK